MIIKNTKLSTILFLISILLISSCTCVSKKQKVEEKSKYMNEIFTSKQPLLYKKNLPYIDDVSTYIALNTYVSLDKEITRTLDKFSDTDLAIDKRVMAEYKTQPIMLEYIPIGTKFQVIDEYQDYRNRFPLVNSKTHILVLRDEDNHKSFIPEYRFQSLFMEKLSKSPYLNSVEINSIKALNNNQIVELIFCPNLRLEPTPDIQRLIDDFNFNDTIKIKKIREGEINCENGTLLVFKDAESFLTAKRHFYKWGVFGIFFELKKEHTPINESPL